jgi:hypothetical protein
MERIAESIVSKLIIFYTLHCKLAEVKRQVTVKAISVRLSFCLSGAVEFHLEIKLKLKFILGFTPVHEILIQHFVIQQAIFLSWLFNDAVRINAYKGIYDV